MIWLLKELKHQRRHRLETGDRNTGRVSKVTGHEAAVDPAPGVLGHPVRIDLEHDELAARGGGIDQRRGITPGSPENRLHAVETARGGSLIAHSEIRPRVEGRRANRQPARRVELAVDEVHFLEISPIVSHGLQSHPLHLGGDVLDSLDVPRGRQEAALHRVVRKDVETRFQICRGDGRRRRCRDVGASAHEHVPVRCGSAF